MINDEYIYIIILQSDTGSKAMLGDFTPDLTTFVLDRLVYCPDRLAHLQLAFGVFKNGLFGVFEIWLNTLRSKTVTDNDNKFDPF